MREDLVMGLFRELLGRGEVEREIVAEVAARLDGLLERLRRVDGPALGALAPAPAFAAASPLHERPLADGQRPRWDLLGGGGTGYGGSRGATGSGTAGAAAAPARPAPPLSARAAALLQMDATAMAEAVRRRQVSPVELVTAALEAIEAVEPALNAFTAVAAEQALAEARRAEEELCRGGACGPLHGVPVAVKDVFETAGLRTTACSRILADYVPARDAAAVSRLRRSGAILVGKTTTHEFAFGALTDSPFCGPTRNPWNPRHVPGGSSGGSGAAVAAGAVPLALGTDTGGSVRIPAALCGTVGLKPTYGRISTDGVLPLAWSLDHVGVLSRTVRDAALALHVLAGPGGPDAPPPAGEDGTGAARAAPLAGVRIGVPESWLERVDPEVARCFAGALDVLRRLGAVAEPVSLPPADAMTLVNRAIALAEAGAYHAPWLAERAADYGLDVRLRLELGQLLPARYYILAQRLRSALCRELHAVMQRVDVVALPTTPVPAPRIGQARWAYPDGLEEPVVEALIRWTAPWNVTGQPAVSLPCGLTARGLPVGLQLVGRPLGEGELLRVAAAFEAQAGFVPLPPGGVRP